MSSLYKVDVVGGLTAEPHYAEKMRRQSWSMVYRQSSTFMARWITNR